MPTLSQSFYHLSKGCAWDAATKPHVLDEIEKIAEGGSTDLLSFYLAQLRVIITHGYPRFIASLIAKIPFDSNDPIQGPREGDNRLILDALTLRLAFFTELAVLFDLLEKVLEPPMSQWIVRPQTKALMADMIVIAHTENALENGLVFLWASETVVLDTWVKAFLQIINLPTFNKRTSPDLVQLGKLAVALEKWHSPEAQHRLPKIRLDVIIDNFGTTPATRDWDRAVMFWKLAVELKAHLWPSPEEAQMGKITAPHTPVMTPPETGLGAAKTTGTSTPTITPPDKASKMMTRRSRIG